LTDCLVSRTNFGSFLKSTNWSAVHWMTQIQTESWLKKEK